MNTMTDRLPISESRTGSPETAAPLLRVSGLNHAFGGQQVLKDVALELRAGEVVLLQGANGSGKTTLLNILTGNLLPDAGVIELHTRREPVRFEFPRRIGDYFRDWGSPGFSPQSLAQLGLGRTWQDIRLFENQCLADNVAVATRHQLGENPLWAVMRRGAVGRQEAEVQRVARLRLTDLGLGDRAESSADRVSLGQSKRVAIARAVQAGAKILCLDEPLAGLDANGIKEVMDWLRELARTEQVTLVIVEHVFNIPRVLNLATTVWTLAEGSVEIRPASLVGAPEAAESQGINHWLRGLSDNVVEHPLPGGAWLKVIRIPGIEIGEVAFKVEELVVKRGKRLVIDRLSFELCRGEMGILFAPNGWGKTTLLEALMGLIPVDRGKVWLNGRSVGNLPTWEKSALGISLLRSRNNVFPGLMVREMLRIAKIRDPGKEIWHLIERKVSDLSGGERQRLILSCSVNRSNENLQLLDEPFSALDISNVCRWQENLIQGLSHCSLMIAVPLES